MLAPYDLDVSPLSFDFAWFLWSSQLKADGKPVHVMIIPGRRDGWRTNDHKPISDAEREWRINHVLIPLIGMAGMTHTVCPARSFAEGWLSRKGVIVIPGPWDEKEPKAVYGPHEGLEAFRAGKSPGWTASERAKQHVDAWLTEHMRGNGPLISITLRETHTLTRNSNPDAWMQVSERLVSQGFRVVVVRDTEKMTTPLMGVPKGVAAFHLASCDLDLRCALYQRAHLNIGRNGGPIYLPAFLGANYLIFGILADPYEENGVRHITPTASMMQRFGMPIGSNIHRDNPKKRLVWKPDTDPDVIFDEVAAAFAPKPAGVFVPPPLFSPAYVPLSA